MDQPLHHAPHWSVLSDDPMDSAVIHARQAELRAVRRPPIPDRAAYLESLATGRRVLDLGVVDHALETDRTEHWLHGRLAGAAREILGVDVLPDAVAALRERGFDVLCMDLSAGERPPGRWDLIVAGELIEHLGSPGGLFDAAAELLADDGLFVLTTPNPYAMWRIVQNLRARPEDNVDHALLLSSWGIAELADRSGLRLRSVRGIRAPAEGWKARLLSAAVRRRILPVSVESTCESILYEVERA